LPDSQRSIRLSDDEGGIAPVTTEKRSAPRPGADRWTPLDIRVRGRRLTIRQLETIIATTDNYFFETRTELSERVCRTLGWRQANGRLWDIGCREVLRHLETSKLIVLPRPVARGAHWNNAAPADLALPYDASPVRLIDLSTVQLRIVETKAAARLWNMFVSRHHYLHSSRIVGRQIKYLVYTDTRPIACLGWGDAAWELRARDEWIGWTRTQRLRNRHRIAANIRFLILPWVRVQNLASYILARSMRQVATDWSAKYGYEPVLLETFVDGRLYSGTCYLAANWQKIGVTAGYAKTGNSHHNSQRPKIVLAYPLQRRFRDILRGLPNS
jgi:hypothetical protein